MNKKTKKTLIWLSLFAIAMGFLESSVVVYLRELYYPDGFKFPLTTIPSQIAKVEFWRETATIIMLIGAGYMAGKTALSRFAYFIIAFAWWDIFYYIFLYIILQWPENLLTWDILFLIPVPWTGPVIAPCLVSIGMMLLGSLIIYYKEKHENIRINPSQWLLLLSGVLIIILSFIEDYLKVTYQSQAFIWTFHSDTDLFQELKTYVPQTFDWILFSIGLLLSASGIFYFYQTSKKQTNTLYENK